MCYFTVRSRRYITEKSVPENAVPKHKICPHRLKCTWKYHSYPSFLRKLTRKGLKWSSFTGSIIPVWFLPMVIAEFHRKRSLFDRFSTPTSTHPPWGPWTCITNSFSFSVFLISSTNLKLISPVSKFQRPDFRCVWVYQWRCASIFTKIWHNNPRTLNDEKSFPSQKLTSTSRDMWHHFYL